MRHHRALPLPLIVPLACLLGMALIALPGCRGCDAPSGDNGGDAGTPGEGTPDAGDQILSALRSRARNSAALCTHFGDADAPTVRRLVELLASDPGLTAGVRALLDMPADRGGALAARFLRDHETPEAYPALALRVLDSDITQDMREDCLRALGHGGLQGMEAVLALAEEFPRRRQVEVAYRAFPHEIQLEFWMARVGGPETATRDRARHEVNFLFHNHRRGDLEIALGALPQIDLDARLWVLDRVRQAGFRVRPDQDEWFIPLLFEAVRDSVREGPDIHIGEKVQDILWTPRRTQLVETVDAWMAANQDSSPGYQVLQGQQRQLHLELRRARPESVDWWLQEPFPEPAPPEPMVDPGYAPMPSPGYRAGLAHPMGEWSAPREVQGASTGLSSRPPERATDSRTSVRTWPY